MNADSNQKEGHSEPLRESNLPEASSTANPREGGTAAETIVRDDGFQNSTSSVQPRDQMENPLDSVTQQGDVGQQVLGSFPPLQLAEEQELEVDELDSDSALGSDSESVTASLTESIYNYRKEYGRTYHAYKDGKYIFPNDEREADRLDLQHHILQLTYGNNLHFAPLNDPKHAIDIGTGTGIWAVDFADEYPNCQVIGIDLSPGQPTLVPPNLKFVIDDAEDQWVYDAPFDYIHVRLMNGCFSDWPQFFHQTYENLEPGGWLEVQDYGLPVTSADGTHLGTDLTRWGELLSEASAALGRPMGSAECSDLHVDRMRDAGFVDIQTRMFMWPSNHWPKDPFMKELGRWNQINILDGLEGFCLALLTRGLGWQKEEVDVLVARVSRDLKDRKIHAYFPMPVVYVEHSEEPFQPHASLNFRRMSDGCTEKSGNLPHKPQQTDASVGTK